jgi:hypothetical protein
MSFIYAVPSNISSITAAKDDNTQIIVFQYETKEILLTEDCKYRMGMIN